MGAPLLRNPNGSLAGGNGPATVDPAQVEADKQAQAQEQARQQALAASTAGTSYSTNSPGYNASYNSQFQPLDTRNFQYGRSATGADEAVKAATDIGSSAYGTGNNLLTQYLGLGAEARARTAPTGDFGQQNAALGQSLGYGQQLAGLENTQGPSAAQAQLQAGTNQALSSQLALARSGRGFGGGAAAMEQAQSNVAGIQANQANSAAALRAQEDAAWRARQASNLGNASAISQGAGTQYGQQANTNLSAYLTNQAQSDQASLGYMGQGATAYGQGVAQNLAAQGLASNIRGQELGAGQNAEDRALRAWAARQGFNLQQQQQSAQERGAIYSGVGTVAGGLIGAFAGGPAGAAAGAAAGNAAGKGLASA